MIKRDLKNMKKRRAAICFLMVFIMSFTLLPSGVFAAQNDSLKAKQQLAEQSKSSTKTKKSRKKKRRQARRLQRRRLRTRQSRKILFACRSFPRK